MNIFGFDLATGMPVRRSGAERAGLRKEPASAKAKVRKPAADKPKAEKPQYARIRIERPTLYKEFKLAAGVRGFTLIQAFTRAMQLFCEEVMRDFDDGKIKP